MSFMGNIGGSGENKEQQPPFLSPPAYHHGRGGWLLDHHSHVGEPSSNHEKQEEGIGGMMVEREHMFDKVVTPSDVGKLNRLVIPKQHAERYFPLDSSTNDKGLLLNFEDMNGKLWRFRYSYWNSSQSYVMTKGWSRFVKDKKLDAGDIVSFQRGVGVTAKDRLFIDWRRRVPPTPTPSSNLSFPFHNHTLFQPRNPLVLQSLPARRNPNLMLQPSSNYNLGSPRSLFFGPGGFGAPQQQVQMMQRSGYGFGFGLRFDPPPVLPALPAQGKASGKRLRLFGVNMDCAFSEDEDDQDYDHTSCSTKNPIIPSSSFSTIPYLQLSPYGGEAECNQSTILSSTSSSAHDFNIITKSTASNMSLDLGM